MRIFNFASIIYWKDSIFCILYSWWHDQQVGDWINFWFTSFIPLICVSKVRYYNAFKYLFIYLFIYLFLVNITWLCRVFCILKSSKGAIQDGYWNTAVDCMSSMNQGFADMLETHLAEVKHKGELKHQHSEQLAGGRSTSQFTSSTATAACQALPHRPMELLLCQLWDLWYLDPLLSPTIGCTPSNPSDSHDLHWTETLRTAKPAIHRHSWSPLHQTHTHKTCISFHNLRSSGNPQTFTILTRPHPSGLHRPASSPLGRALKTCKSGNPQAFTTYALPGSLLRPVQACMISALMCSTPKSCQAGDLQTCMFSTLPGPHP
jgi:hypothetical protein